MFVWHSVDRSPFHRGAQPAMATAYFVKDGNIFRGHFKMEGPLWSASYHSSILFLLMGLASF